MAESTARARKKTHIIDSWNELPDELKKKTLRSGISEAEACAHFEILLNVLHFKTKQNFYTKKMYSNKSKMKYNRYNKEHSLIHESIVSVNPLHQETEDLLLEFKKKSYKIGSLVGKGGFGKVFSARLSPEECKVAIKKMPHQTIKQKRKNFQEIRFLKYLKGHPNIINFTHASIYKDEMWLVTEYLDGGTLSQAISIHQFNEPQIAYISREVLQALSYMHSNMLCHRDLKTANIMLYNGGGIKLIDYGLCSDISQGMVVHMVGSPFWMPPEMIKRQPHGLPVDVWSFGVCLLELANGYPPNKKSSFKAMFVAATVGYPNPLEKDKWSGEFKDFINKCLQVIPENRSTVPQLIKQDFLNKAVERNIMAEIVKNVVIANKM